MAIEEEIEAYRQRGFFIVRDIVESAMLDQLEVATRRIRANFSAKDRTQSELIDPRWGEPVFCDYMNSPAVTRNGRC